MPGRVFGEIAGVPPGTIFDTRQELAKAGVHRPTQAGISGAAAEGADSIVVSGGYEDDEDFGDEIIYTGHGGNVDGVQVEDQTLTRGNMALAKSCDQGLPVRVVRGAQGDAAHSPPSGYRYDGVFNVAEYWLEEGISGFDVWRFRLVREDFEPIGGATTPPPGADPGEPQYQATLRRIRSTAVTQWVKALYDFTCQVCGERLEMPTGAYAEGAHIRPLGQPHLGPDEAANVLCLCPNDHVRFDRGVIGISDALEVIDLQTGSVRGELAVDSSHELDLEHLSYHREMHGAP